MSPLVLLLCTICWSSATAGSLPPFELEYAELYFENFIQTYGKQYADEQERQAKFEAFKDNMAEIIQLNMGKDEPEYGINEFSDLTSEEFLQTHTGLGGVGVSDYRKECPYSSDGDIPNANAPESFDWREKGAVTPVKNQNSCGSCYAFSSIGCIESAYAIKHGQMMDLAEQQIVDCDKRNHGCQGGYMTNVFRSLIEQTGCENESDYPYTSSASSCRFNQNKVAVKVTGCHGYQLTSQEKLKQLLYHNGPIAIAVQARALQQRRGGIISDQECDVGQVNHAVLLVGYGKEGNTPYWIVKNSWGATWNEKGYFRMERGEGKKSCGMMNDMMATVEIA